MNVLFATLTLVTFFPVLGVLALLFVPEEQKDTLRWTAVVTSVITFILSLVMLAQFNPADPGMQLVIRAPWINIGSTWNIDFHMGIDGASLLLVLLTTFLTPIAIFSSWTAIGERVKEYMIFFLLLEVGMVGVFVSLDLFLFYVFWE
ncbi:MAG: Fe-S-binding domain-containing protein, partial [Chloroflexi bacterium]|nr:Fe-S-binding domain-containing protein [Chloroflexota bacterium]